MARLDAQLQTLRMRCNKQIRRLIAMKMRVGTLSCSTVICFNGANTRTYLKEEQKITSNTNSHEECINALCYVISKDLNTVLAL
jgi:hypothetical protein